MLFGDRALDLGQQHRVIEHVQVRIEEAGVAGAEAFGDFALDLLDFVPGVQERLFEALKLGRDFGRGKLNAREVVFLGGAEDKDSPAANAR